ncbi:carbon catabolit repression protein [Streptomyces hebeiensis]|uniref:Carbon catabolit repression protein n=1 Tax=Streptomyces hebeiensis TaxID=229486 RepID=A0ABN1UYL2_9ACTN
MSDTDAGGRPAGDADAWATACAEDLEAERARLRAVHGRPPGSAAEELRKLVDAVADKVAALPGPLFGVAAQGAVRQFVDQAKAAVEPVIERNPDVLDHLAAAGNELLAAYRSVVETQETRWTRESSKSSGPSGTEGPTEPTERTRSVKPTEPPGPAGGTDAPDGPRDARGTPGPPGPQDSRKAGDPTDPRDEGPGPDGRIDLD